MPVNEGRTGGLMKNVVSFLIIFFLAAASFAAGPQDSNLPHKEKCTACGMFVSMFADWSARIGFKDATQAIFCGAKCMFKYYLNMNKYNPSKNKNDVTVISVKDYYSKTSIDALQASFVIWSDVYGPMGHEPIPFEKEADAKKFLKEHKGKKILGFKDISLNVIRSLDNP
jgi:nitrous oxide reductase accessory protein NosL